MLSKGCGKIMKRARKYPQNISSLGNDVWPRRKIIALVWLVVRYSDRYVIKDVLS